MALQVGSYSASQVQNAYTSPLQQRAEDQDKRAEQRESEFARSQTRVQGTSSAESQKSRQVQTSARDEDDESRKPDSSKQRGSLLDISV